MKPLIWAGIAGAVTAIGLALVTRNEKTPSAPPTPPQPTYGETEIVPQAVPAGWRRVTDSEVAALPELGVAASTLRSTPGFTSMQYGTLMPFVASDGGTYATWVEQHYHAPGGAAQPWGYHHGVTLLASMA